MFLMLLVLPAVEGDEKCVRLLISGSQHAPSDTVDTASLVWYVLRPALDLIVNSAK